MRQGLELAKAGLAKSETFESAWDAIAGTLGQRASLRVRAGLMRQVAAIVKKSGWTEVEAARRCRVTQLRISDLLRSRVSRFSIDALVNMAAAIGWNAHFEL